MGSRRSTDAVPARFVVRHFGDAMRQFAYDVTLGHRPNMATVDEDDDLCRDVRVAAMMLYENMDSGQPKLELMPSYFGHSLTKEIVSVEIAYGIGRLVFQDFRGFVLAFVLISTLTLCLLLNSLIANSRLK